MPGLSSILDQIRKSTTRMETRFTSSAFRSKDYRVCIDKAFVESFPGYVEVAEIEFLKANILR